MNTSNLYLSIYLSTVIGGPDAERSPTGPDAIRHRSKSVGEPVQVELCPPVSARHLDDRHRRTVSGEQQGGRCRQRRPGRRQRRGGRRLVVGAGRRRTDARVWHPSLRRVFRPTASAIALRGLHLAADNVLRKQHTHPFNGPLSRTTWVSRYQKGKTNLDFTKRETVSGSGISWAMCKSAPRSRQISTPALYTTQFLQTGRHYCRPTNSVKAMKVSK